MILGPDDIVVVRSPKLDGRLTGKKARATVDTIAKATGATHILVVDSTTDISTLRLDQCPSDFVNDLVTAVVRRMADHLRLDPPQ